MSRAAFAVVVAWLLGAACSREVRPQVPATPPRKATLLIAANWNGALAPCGCSENMRGGLDKAAYQVARARSEGAPVALLAGGDTLFGTATVSDEARAQAQMKAQTLARGLEAMGVAVDVPGRFDDALGPEFRASLALPWLTGPRVLDVGPVKVGVIAPADVPTAQAQASQVRSQGAQVVVAFLPVAFDLGLHAALTDGLGVDLIVTTHPRDALAAEHNRLAGGRVKVAQLQDRGRSLLRVDLSLLDGAPFEWLRIGAERDRELEAMGERIEQLRAQTNAPGISTELHALKQAKLDEVVARRDALAGEPLPAPNDKSAGIARFVPLEPSLPGDPAMQALLVEHDRRVGELNLAWAAEHGQDCEPFAPGKPGILGPGVCLGCHPATQPQWETLKHRQAYTALIAKGKQAHLDCITCHVTGWKQPNGVCRVDKVEGRAEVGCEACHGPGSDHLMNPVKATIWRGTDEKICQRCHDLENSPHFVYDVYVQRIVGPGHGQPVPDGGIPLADGGVWLPPAPPPPPDAGVPKAHPKKPRHR